MHHWGQAPVVRFLSHKQVAAKKCTTGA